MSNGSGLIAALARSLVQVFDGRGNLSTGTEFIYLDAIKS